MVDEFIKLFTGYRGDFGIADISSNSDDADKNKWDICNICLLYTSDAADE